MKTFEELGVREDLLTAIKKIGFYEPTEIQTASIPLILAGKDIIAGSNTGSGKTFAFGAGVIQQLHPQGGVQALILVPTRELAEQMLHAFQSFCKKTPIRIAAVYGGVAIGPQFKALRQSEIVIGTPGRTLDHLERRTLKLDRVKHLVLDEADRMLDMGFLPDIKRILKQSPTEKQVLLFSATMPTEIKKLAGQFMNNPEHINLAEQVDPSKLSQETYLVNGKSKQELLTHLIREENEKELVIVFCNTRSQVDNTTKRLKKEGIKATAIHGGLSQNQRLRVIKVFNSKNNLNVLVCTDVAARGLDIPGVTHVYNYDIPREPKQYIHRIGRTARAGADGKAINLVSERDMGNYRQVLRNNSLKIPQLDVPVADYGFDPNNVKETSNARGRRPFNKDRRGSSNRRKVNPKRAPRRESLSPKERRLQEEISERPQRGTGRFSRSSAPRKESRDERPSRSSYSRDDNRKSFDRKPKKNFGQGGRQASRNSRPQKNSFYRKRKK